MVTRASITTAHAVANLAAARLGRRRSVSMMISLRSSWQSCTSTVISHALRRISAARVPSSRAGSSSERSESFSLFFAFFCGFSALIYAGAESGKAGEASTKNGESPADKKSYSSDFSRELARWIFFKFFLMFFLLFVVFYREIFFAY